MKTICLYLAFLCVLSSCVTQRRCSAKFPPTVQRDSIYIETLKEIPIYLPGDSIKVEVPVNCPDQIIANVETARLSQQIEILKGKLISSTHIKPDTVKVYVPEIKTVVTTVQVPQPVKFVPKLVKILAWIGGAGIVLFFTWLVLKFTKRI